MSGDLAKDIERNIRRNLGVFSSPAFNHVGDPHDKHSTRPTLTTRAGLSRNPSSNFWRESIEKEGRGPRPKRLVPEGYAAGAGNLHLPPQPQSAAPPAAAATDACMPPGYYMVPSLLADGSTTYALAYVPYYFQAPGSERR